MESKFLSNILGGCSEETVSDFAGLKVYLLCVLIGGCFGGDLERLCSIEGKQRVQIKHNKPNYLKMCDVEIKGFSAFFVRIRDCLAELYAKEITLDDKRDLDKALHRENALLIQFSSWMGDNRDDELYRSARSIVKHYIETSSRAGMGSFDVNVGTMPPIGDM
uniref:Phosphoenolpyruvate carboxylase n=1 Tax=Tanacetum cinerariifolium TaxID=118510 RepID=A0A6L2KDQ4_TANCI|nr:phosphoenolpyruvate carboxylase [Tanacetum cinerariifolium]